MSRRLFSLLSLMTILVVLTGCGVSASSKNAQLAFEAQMDVDSDQRFHVSLGVRNMGEARFREYENFRGKMELRDDAGAEIGRISVATLWELAPGNAGWPASYASNLSAGAYQLTWGSPDYGSVTIDFTLIERDGQIYLSEESVQSTSEAVSMKK